MRVLREDDDRVRGEVGEGFGAHFLEGGGFGGAVAVGAGEGVGLALVAADRIEPLLAKLDTRARIGSFGYIDWQACWPSRTRLTADSRLILRNEAGEWTVIPLSDLIER